MRQFLCCWFQKKLEILCDECRKDVGTVILMASVKSLLLSAYAVSILLKAIHCRLLEMA